MFSLSKTALVIALLVIAGVNAFAFVSGIPEEMVFKEIPLDITFSVTNTENVARELSANAFFPVEYIFLQKPGVIGAGAAEIVKLRLYPRSDLLGAGYFGTIDVSLGISEVQKQVRLKFLQQDSCPVSVNSSIREEQSPDGRVFVIVSKIENHKHGQVAFFFDRVEGLPAGWKVLPAGEMTKLGPLERAGHEITLVSAENFEGEITAVFNCDGFSEKRTAMVSFADEKGFFSAVSGLFSFGSLFGGTLVDFALMFIAAVLLIAFISRLVKKFSSQKTVEEKNVLQYPALGAGKFDGAQKQRPVLRFSGSGLEALRDQITKK